MKRAWKNTATVFPFSLCPFYLFSIDYETLQFSPGELDHVLNWDEKEKRFEIGRHCAMYTSTTGNLNSYGEFQVKCKLCKNSKNKPQDFSVSHLGSQVHQKALMKRMEAINILRDITLEANFSKAIPIASMIS